MYPALDAALALAAFLGHFSLAVYIFNRVHARAWPWRFVKVLEKLILVGAATVLLAGIVASIVSGGFVVSWADGQRIASTPALAYTILCWICAALVLPMWLWPKLLERTPAALIANDTTVIDVAKKLGHQPVHGKKVRVLAAFPGTEIFQLHVQRKTLRLPQLPPELDGLTIAHLSDLHMTGDLTEDFYQEVVAATNALQPDLVAITGDILEKTPCLPWIAGTLGQLTARHGKYFILGNHELRLGDAAPLRSALVAAGLVDLGDRWLRVSLRGTDVDLVGTEFPWFGSAPEVLSTKYPEISRKPGLASNSAATPAPPLALSSSPPPPLRLLLSHTPDHLPWAREHHFDLMLAGHNHGGQIRLPWLGALITPSRYGFRYAGGLYHEPPTLLHVSRGISGAPPIRLNCPPEITLLVLRR